MDDSDAPAAGNASRPAQSRPADVQVLPEIELYELDDIPLAFLPMAGSTILTIAFRVGRADEPAIRGGMTHLTEHLVMTSVAGELDRSLDHSNGTTEPFRVTFTLRGSPHDTSRFLRDLCRAIEKPALQRMHQEADVLRTEGAARGPSGLSFRSIWFRTGFQGVGTSNLPELFLHGLDEDVLRSWIAEHFVAGNAAIWIAGELPDDLFISLPPGPRKPVPEVRWIPGFETPTIVGDDVPGVAASFFVDRSAAVVAAMRTLDSRLRRALRVDRGLGYDVGGEYIPVSATEALATVWATCLPKAVEEVERIALETIDDVAARGPSDDELHHQYERYARDAVDPMAIPARLDAHVRDVLMGAAPTTLTDLLEEAWRLQSAEVAAAFKRARDTMLLLVPANGVRPQRPFKRYPGPSGDPMGSGRTFDLVSEKGHAPWRKAKAPKLTVADAGVAVDDAGGRRLVGISWVDSVAVLRQGNVRTLLGRDGAGLTIDPAEWKDGRGAVGMVDRFAPSDKVVNVSD